MKISIPKPLSRTIVNLYKRHDVFKCIHQSHAHFEHRVSVYHVLKEKKCFPQGCIYFNWKCRILNKGKTCSRKFKHVGRMCFNCKEFYDEKEIFNPELLLSQDDYQSFLKDLEAYEDWLEDVGSKEVEFSGTINSVKPSFRNTNNQKKNQLSFDGFLINFNGGFINLDYFDDFVYAKVSSRMQQRFKFCKGDKLTFYARIKEQRGRIVLFRLNRIEIEEKADSEIWTESKAQLANRTGTIISRQYEKCLSCDKGTLIDTSADPRRQRMLLCLEGIKDPHHCIYTISKLLLADHCAKEEKRGDGSFY